LGKNKLKRFIELETMDRVFQPKGFYLGEEYELKGKWNSEVFLNDNPLILELGCGRGEYTINLAKDNPGKNFIGVDKKGARLWRGAKTSNEENMVNSAFLRINIERISSYFASEEIDEIWITFPDPQPQNTRENMRMTSQRFLDMYKVLLKPGGVVHLKTDSSFLYSYTLDKLVENNIQPIIASDNIYDDQNRDDVLNIHTTYEKKFLMKGKNICYLKFILKN
jgi:tRNA (guanine-N7-)-methyltransferase